MDRLFVQLQSSNELNVDTEKLASWLLSAVAAKSLVFAGFQPETQRSLDLFESQLLDSMALMDLLISTENEFDFRFTLDSFLDERIKTINGIVQIIQEITC